MDIERARFNMVEQQIRTWEVLDQDVLDLLYVVRREEFVPAAYRALAFSDLEIPLAGTASGPTERMLHPKVEARILQEVAPKKDERVLEIGAGSGYMAALLAARARSVVTVEINPDLAAMAERNLKSAGVGNAVVERGDAAQGWTRHAPYDVIVVSGSLPVLPPALVAQIAQGGRLFAIIGDPPVMAARLLRVVGPGTTDTIDLFETCFPSMTNALQPERFTF
jgi:protein-L-isoaspartate(D-aspartate) O-methyltransferase